MSMESQRRISESRRYVFACHGRRERASRRRPRPQNARAPAVEPRDPLSFPEIIGHENLRAVFEQLRAQGGQASGIDRVSYPDLSPATIAAALRNVARDLQAKIYLPAMHVTSRVPKRDGRGLRDLQLRSILDRVVSSAVANPLAARLDSIFLPCAAAFRPGRGIWQVYASLQRAIESSSRRIIVTDDIRRAYPSLPVGPCIDAYRRHILDPDLLWLIETILRGHAGQARTVGIDAGDPLSPLTLNLFMHYIFDLPMRSAGRVFPLYVRYVDDLVYLVDSVSDGREALQLARELLSPHGLTLKGRNVKAVDLREPEAAVEILGLRLFLVGDRVCYKMRAGARQELYTSLEKVWDSWEPIKTAGETLRGWVESLGPVIESVGPDEVVATAMQEASRAEVPEAARRREMLRWAEQARQRWLTVRGAGSGGLR